jgi:predicted transcriptional regulator
MAETIVLDPAAVATSRTSVDITAFVSSEGIDWGDAAIEAYMADAERGSTVVDFRIPNRIVTIPL